MLGCFFMLAIPSRKGPKKPTIERPWTKKVDFSSNRKKSNASGLLFRQVPTDVGFFNCEFFSTSKISECQTQNRAHGETLTRVAPNFARSDTGNTSISSIPNGHGKLIFQDPQKNQMSLNSHFCQTRPFFDQIS